MFLKNDIIFFNINNGFESFIIELETYEGKNPMECLKYASMFLMEYFYFLMNFGPNCPNSKLFTRQVINIDLNPILFYRIETLNLSSRAYNCLISENIIFVGDLVQKFEDDLLKIPFYSKILFEIKNTLILKGLTLGMFIKNWAQFK